MPTNDERYTPGPHHRRTGLAGDAVAVELRLRAGAATIGCLRKILHEHPRNGIGHRPTHRIRPVAPDDLAVFVMHFAQERRRQQHTVIGDGTITRGELHRGRLPFVSLAQRRPRIVGVHPDRRARQLAAGFAGKAGGRRHAEPEVADRLELLSGRSRCANLEMAMLLEYFTVAARVTGPVSLCSSRIVRVVRPSSITQTPPSPSTGIVSAPPRSSNAATVNSFDVDPGSFGSTSADDVDAS